MTPIEQEHRESNWTSLLTRTPVPPQVPSAVAQPWLYSAVLGNGRLLVCLDEAGSLAQLFYPRLDAGPHIHSFLLGIQTIPSEEASMAEPEVAWLAQTDWTHQLNYVEGAATMRCS